MKDAQGITLVELLIVISVIGILVIALGFSFQGWIGAYRVESEIKEMHVDLMNARARAMSRGRVFCVALTANQYTIREDMDPAPDGDGDCDDANDTIIRQKTLPYNIQWAISFGDSAFRFNRYGVSTHDGDIRLVSTATPDYDCIVLFSTRINLGQWNGANCVAR